MTAPPRCTDRCNRMSDRGLCDWCDRRVARELAELPELWTMLHACLQPASRGGDGRGSGELSLGVRVDVLSFLGFAGEPSADVASAAGVEFHADDQTGPTPLLAVLSSWARLAAEEFGYATRTWTFTVTRKWLVAHHDRICRQPWADDYAAEVHAAWQVAKTLTGTWQSAELLRQRYCPWCKAGALYQEPDRIECQVRAGGCGRRMAVEEYERMAKMRARWLDGSHCPWCEEDTLYAPEGGTEEAECMVGMGGCGRRLDRAVYDLMCRQRAAYDRADGAA